MGLGWSEMRASFPRELQPAQAHIIDAVRRGDYVEPDWCLVELAHPTLPISAFYEVMCDALRIGKPGDSVRVNVTHATTQAIADLLGVRVLTSKLVDDIDGQADRFVEPLLKANSTKVAAMVEHSEALDAKIGNRAPGELVGGIGKVWINHPRMMNPTIEKYGKDTAINYGWSSRHPVKPGAKRPWQSASRPNQLAVWQQPGGAHNAGIADVTRGHVDRSQFARFGRPLLTVSEAGISLPMAIDAVALDPRLSRLVSVDGPVLMRHPWTTPCLSLAEGGTCPNVPQPEADPPKADGPRVAWAVVAVAGGAAAWYLWAHG